MAILVVSYPQNVFAKESSSSAVVRQNLNFITGKPGDTYLVYIYDENDTSYKVVESSDKNFENVNSTIYKLNSKKVYEVYSTEAVKLLINDDITIAVKENGNVYTNTIVPDDTNDSNDVVAPTSKSVSSLANSLASATPVQTAWSSWTESTGNTYIKLNSYCTYCSIGSNINSWM